MKKPWKTLGRKGVAFILSVAMVFTMIPNLSYALQAAEVEDQTQTEQQKDTTKGGSDVLDVAPGGAEDDGAVGTADPDTEKTEDAAKDSDVDVAVEQDGSAGRSGGSGTSVKDDQNSNDQTGGSGSDADKKDKEEISYPAASFEKEADGMKVTIKAPAGALPEGTTVKVRKVSKKELAETVQDAYNKKTKVYKAVDITFYDKDGNKIEPKEEVSVSFATGDLGNIEKAKVIHLTDEGDIEKVTGSKVDTDKNKATFKSDEFSIYAIIGQEADYRLKVIFKSGNEEIDSMYVKDTDDMEVVLYDPGAGELKDGVYFRGWTTNPNYTSETEALTIDDVRTEVKDMLPPENDGDEVTYYAMLFKDYRITYLDEHNISLGQEELTFRADALSNEQTYTVNMGYTVQDDTHHFEGWNVIEGGSNISGHHTGDIYQNADEITITGDVTFGVNAPEGHWFIFDENGKGATYTAPQFVYSSDHPTPPSDSSMTRNGYTFGGWYEDKSVADQTSGGTRYDFSQTLSDRTTVYARWIPKTEAPYTVIIWKQNIDGDGYDFEESIPLNGNVGSTINTVTQQGTGNKLQATGNRSS